MQKSEKANVEKVSSGQIWWKLIFLTYIQNTMLGEKVILHITLSKWVEHGGGGIMLCRCFLSTLIRKLVRIDRQWKLKKICQIMQQMQVAL